MISTVLVEKEPTEKEENMKREKKKKPKETDNGFLENMIAQRQA